MSSIIRKFNDFHNVNEGDSLVSRAFSYLGDATVDVVKGKLIDILISKLGVSTQSFGADVVRNLVETMSLSEYPKIISGGLTVRDLAPKLADATIETLTDLGVEGVATRILKLEPGKRDSVLYRMVQELIGNKAREADFREQLVDMWSWVLGGSTSSSSGKNAAINLITGGKSPKTGSSSGSSSASNSPDDWSMQNILKAMQSGDLTSQGRGSINQ